MPFAITTIVLSPPSVPGKTSNRQLTSWFPVATAMVLKLWVRAKNLCPVALLVIRTRG
jgi:hypothetical protein